MYLIRSKTWAKGNMSKNQNASTQMAQQYAHNDTIQLISKNIQHKKEFKCQKKAFDIGKESSGHHATSHLMTKIIHIQ